MPHEKEISLLEVIVTSRFYMPFIYLEQTEPNDASFVGYFSGRGGWYGLDWLAFQSRANVMSLLRGTNIMVLEQILA